MARKCSTCAYFDPSRSVCEWGAITTAPHWTVLLTPAAHPVDPEDGANCNAHARRFWDARGRIESGTLDGAAYTGARKTPAELERERRAVRS